MVQNKNYQVILDGMLDEIKDLPIRPKLLLHACCAPCSSYVLEYLSKYFEITLFYYNPNIYPKEEYERRRDELGKFVRSASYNILVVEKKYNDKEYYNAVKGLEKLGEKSERCFKCYELRMREAGLYAKENDFDYFTTTLSISPHKVSEKINEIGEKLEKELGIAYLYADFKKKNGYKRSLELSKKYGLYRQDYCGCVYSKIEREGQMKEKSKKPYDEKILEKGLPGYLERDIESLKEGLKNNVSYIDCLINEVQGSTNSAWVDGDISEEQCDYIYKKYIRMEK